MTSLPWLIWSVCLSVCQCVCLPACLSECLSVCLYDCMLVNLMFVRFDYDTSLSLRHKKRYPIKFDWFEECLYYWHFCCFCVFSQDFTIISNKDNEKSKFIFQLDFCCIGNSIFFKKNIGFVYLSVLTKALEFLFNYDPKSLNSAWHWGIQKSVPELAAKGLKFDDKQSN